MESASTIESVSSTPRVLYSCDFMFFSFLWNPNSSHRSSTEIQPRGGGRGEVAVKARMLFQPCPDFGVIVRTVVVQNHMDRQLFGGFTVDLPQKLPKFDVPMPRITRTDDLALQ